MMYGDCCVLECDPHSLVELSRYFRSSCCLLHHGKSVPW